MRCPLKANLLHKIQLKRVNLLMTKSQNSKRVTLWMYLNNVCTFCQAEGQSPKDRQVICLLFKKQKLTVKQNVR
jgi:hypothetical protein